MLLARIVGERTLMFEPLVPNETTIAAIREARSVALPGFASVEDLMSVGKRPMTCRSPALRLLVCYADAAGDPSITGVGLESAVTG